MGKFTTSLVAAFLASCLNAHAANYYVDQSAGSDSNNGTTPTAAWKNCPGMASYTGSGTLSPGDVVNFDRGDTWLVTGMQGLYLVGGVTYIGDTWGSGTRATIMANADLEAGVVRFRDHPTLPTIFKGFNVDANAKLTSGIDINHAFYSLMTGATKRVQNCEVHNVSSRVSLNQYKYGIIVSNHGGTSGYAENVEILDSVVHDVSRDAICLYPGSENASCRIKNITVRGNEAYNTGQDPDYCCGAGILIKGFVQDAYVENNYVHDVKGASAFINSTEPNHFGTGPTNIHLRYNVFTNSTVNGAIRLYDGADSSDPKDVKIYGNLVYNSTVNGGVLLGTDLHNNILNVLIYNNTFFNAPVMVDDLGLATITALDFRNNIVYFAGGAPLTDVARKITSHSNNVYFRSSGTLVSSGGTSYTSGNLSTYEPSASAADPLFKNGSSLPTGFSGSFGVSLAPNTDGLSLRAGSIGIDHGIALSSPYASAINTVPRPAGAGWDVGAYEAGVGAPPTAPTGLRIR